VLTRLIPWCTVASVFSVDNPPTQGRLIRHNLEKAENPGRTNCAWDENN